MPSVKQVYFSNADGSTWIFDEYLKPFGTSSAHCELPLCPLLHLRPKLQTVEEIESHSSVH